MHKYICSCNDDVPMVSLNFNSDTIILMDVDMPWLTEQIKSIILLTAELLVGFSIHVLVNNHFI